MYRSSGLLAVARRLRLRPATWIVIGMALALAIRTAWLDAALGRDEGGIAFIAQSWNHAGAFAYGNYFLDRPPLLLGVFKVAVAAGGATGIRILGAICAAAAVAIITLLATRLSGPRAAPWAALIGAILVSSLALEAVFTPSELIAIVPSAASVLMLVWAIDSEDGGLWKWAAAAVLAACALLVKQSFFDALAAGLVAVAMRRSLARAGAYLGGLAAVALALFVWQQVSGTPAHGLWYSIVGFRLDAAHRLTGGGTLGTRLGRLGAPLVDSGLAVALALAVIGIAMLGRHRVLLAAWLVAGAIGVLGGGSYWAHYLIELVPVAAVGSAALLSKRTAPALLALGLVLLPAARFMVGPIRLDDGDTLQRTAVAVGRYVHDRAELGQTDYVLYARADVLYYSGLPNPYPYNWSLMLRAAPHAIPRLRALLASSQRPTWVVEWQAPPAFGLDKGGATGRLIARHYTRVARVCGHPLLLARGARARPAPSRVRCA
jgi:hypothetical protein